VTGVLLYDRDCAFCSRCAALAERLPVLADVQPYQWADLQALGVTAAQCAAAVQWVVPGRPARSGASAVAGLLVASGPPFDYAGALMQLPGVRLVAERIYRLVAQNRHRLPGGTAACRLPS